MPPATATPDVQPWPFPQDTALDRARSIARSALNAVRRHSPTEADALEEQACRFGESWVRARAAPPDADGLVSAGELAERLGVSASRVRDMASRGVGAGSHEGRGRKLTRYPGGLFDPVEASELLAAARAGRVDKGGGGSSLSA